MPKRAPRWPPRVDSLAGVFDHVAIAVSDLAASARFFRSVISVLGLEPSHADAELVEWEDWDIGPTDREHPVTRGLHVGFRAPSRAAVDAFWQAGIDAGHPDDGPPGPRPEYGPDYYGAVLRDPDGNSAEAIHSERANPVQPGRIDHVWIRVADLAASKRFYSTIAPHAGIALSDDGRGVSSSPGDGSFALVDDGRPRTEHVHLAFRPPTTRPSAPSTRPRSPPATTITAGPASARSTTPATTARSCSTPTATTSRSSTTTAGDRWPASAISSLPKASPRPPRSMEGTAERATAIGAGSACADVGRPHVRRSRCDTSAQVAGPEHRHYAPDADEHEDDRVGAVAGAHDGLLDDRGGRDGTRRGLLGPYVLAGDGAGRGGQREEDAGHRS